MNVTEGTEDPSVGCVNHLILDQPSFVSSEGWKSRADCQTSDSAKPAKTSGMNVVRD